MRTTAIPAPYKAALDPDALRDAFDAFDLAWAELQKMPDGYDLQQARNLLAKRIVQAIQEHGERNNCKGCAMAQPHEGRTDRRSSRSTTWVDSYIGRRIQQRRVVMGLSQSEVGRRVGLTFQQIQKFEIGFNRVAASRLADIAAALNAAPGDFFPPMGESTLALQRDDMTQSLHAVADLIASYEESIEALRRLQRRLAQSEGGP